MTGKLLVQGGWGKSLATALKEPSHAYLLQPSQAELLRKRSIFRKILDQGHKNYIRK